MTRRFALAALAFAAAVTLVSWRVAANLNVPGRPDLEYFAMADFRDAVYYPVVALLDGNNPYDHAAYRRFYPIVSTFPPYSPLTLLVHLPFALLDLTTAEVCYYVLNLLLFLPIAALTLHLCGLEARPAHWLGLAALLILSRPGQSSLFLGQYAPSMVFGTYTALAFARSRPGLAALGLALTTMKPTFGLPLVVLLWAFGATRTALLGVAIGVAGAAIPAAVLVANAGGPAELVATTWAGHGAFSASSINSVAMSLTRIDVAALIGHWVAAPRGIALDAIVFTSVLSLAAVAAYRLRGDVDRGATQLAGVIVCLATLGALYHQSYDALLLAFPQVAVVTGRLVPARSTAQITLAALLLLPAVNYLSSFRAVGALGIDGAAERVLASVNGVALLAALAICLMLAARRSRAGTIASGAERATSPALAVQR